MLTDSEVDELARIAKRVRAGEIKKHWPSATVQKWNLMDNRHKEAWRAAVRAVISRVLQMHGAKEAESE